MNLDWAYKIKARAEVGEAINPISIIYAEEVLGEKIYVKKIKPYRDCKQAASGGDEEL